LNFRHETLLSVKLLINKVLQTTEFMARMYCFSVWLEATGLEQGHFCVVRSSQRERNAVGGHQPCNALEEGRLMAARCCCWYWRCNLTQEGLGSHCVHTAEVQRIWCRTCLKLCLVLPQARFGWRWRRPQQHKSIDYPLQNCRSVHIQ